MTPLTLAVVLLRVYALTLVVQGVGAAMSVLPLFWAGPEETMSGSSMPVRVWGVVDGFAILLILGFAAFLALRTEKVARFVCRGLPGGDEISVGARDLAIVGFGILGLYLVVDGVPMLAYALARWGWGNLYFDMYFFGGALKTVVGLLLFVTPFGFLRVARWLRRAGAPEPLTPPTPPA